MKKKEKKEKKEKKGNANFFSYSQSQAWINIE